MPQISVIALWDSVRTVHGGYTSGTVAVSIPGPNLISTSTATSGFTGSHLVGISSDGKHVVDVDPNTLIAAGAVSSVNSKTGAVVLAAADVGADPAGTAATSMAAHVANLDPHTQYALDADLAGYSVVGHTHAASAIVSGTLADARLSANVPRFDTGGTFTNTVTISATTAAGLVINGKSGYYPLTINRDSALGGGVGVQAGPDGSLSAITFQTTGGIRVTAFGAYVGVLAYNRIEFPSTGLDTYVAASGNSYRLHGEASQTADLFQLLLPTSTGTRRPVYGLRPGWPAPTDAVRRAKFEEYVYDTSERLLRRGYSDGSRGYLTQTVHTTAPADADLQNSELAFYTDGTNLLGKLKDSGGTVHAITTGGGSGSSGISGPINYPLISDASSASGYSPYYDSRTFAGIIGDGTTDDAAAVRSAIATIAAAGGGTLYMAPVRASGVNAAYKFGSALGVIPPNVSIKGPFETSALGIGNRFYGTDGSTTLDDTFLTDPATIPGVWLIYADAGTTTNSFMKPWKNSTISGIAAYYPSQAKVGSAGTPTQYPWFIEVGNGSQVTIKDLGVVNPYQLIYINGGWRTVVDNITSQPYSVGVKVNNSYDVSRITRVHFECFWDSYEPAPGSFSCPWSLNFGYAFIIQRCDLTQVMNCFAYGYRYGLVLQSSDGTQTNSPWATFTNVHFDLCQSSVIAQQSQKYGTSFSNCMFTFNSGANVVDSQSTNDGLLSFSNCLFVGQSAGVTQAGSGEVNISGCTFDVITGGGTTFLNHSGGGMFATGNNFRADKPQYANTSGALSALLVGNRVKGTVRMPNTATIANFLSANNLAS